MIKKKNMAWIHICQQKWGGEGACQIPSLCWVPSLSKQACPHLDCKGAGLLNAKKNAMWLHKRAFSFFHGSQRDWQSNELNTGSDSDLAGNWYRHCEWNNSSLIALDVNYINYSVFLKEGRGMLAGRDAALYVNPNRCTSMSLANSGKGENPSDMEACMH